MPSLTLELKDKKTRFGDFFQFFSISYRFMRLVVCYHVLGYWKI